MTTRGVFHLYALNALNALNAFNAIITQQIFFPRQIRTGAAGLTSGKRKAENGKRNRRTKQEQRLLADYALQEGGKACEAGLKRKAEN